MKNPPAAYWKLFKVIQNRTLPYITSGPGQQSDLLNPVFGFPTPKDIPKKPEPSANERYWINWMYEFVEIDSSLKRLNQALVYLSQPPRSRAMRFHRLSEADWLRYHIEAYFQETYIIHQRLSRFLKRVERSANRGSDDSGVAAAKKLRSVVEASLDGVVRVRGGHVHEHRFDSDELRDLDLLVLLTTAGKEHKLRGFRNFRYLTALIKWRKQLLHNNRQIQKLCVAIVEETTDVLTRNEPPRRTAKRSKPPDSPPGMRTS